MLKDIIDILKKSTDGKVLFGTPVEIKEVCVIHGAAFGNFDQGLWLLDGSGEWHRLETRDPNYSLVAKAVLDKLIPSFDEAYGTAF